MQLTVSDMVIHVPECVYKVPLSRQITLTNTGEVAAMWRFVPKPEEKLVCKVCTLSTSPDTHRLQRANRVIHAPSPRSLLYFFVTDVADD